MILLVDCYIDISGGAVNFLPYLPEGTFVWKAVHKPLTLSMKDIDAIVVTGSAACVGDGDDWLQRLLGFLATAINEGTPCFGVCFGHQILAHLCGATVDKMPRPEVGWKQITLLEGNPLWKDIPKSFGCFLSHEDGVLVAGEKIDVLASSDECSIQAFQHRDHLVFGIQFHPEMSMEESQGLLVYRSNKHKMLNIDVSKETKLLQNNRKLAQQIFHNFLSVLS